MIRLIDTPADHVPRPGLSWVWSWVTWAEDDRRIGIALKTARRTLLLVWGR